MSTGAGGHWAGVLFQGSSLTATPESGISTDALRNMPRGVLTSGLYAARLTGLSGTVAVRIFGSVGGVTIPIVGRTGMTAGSFQLWNLTNGNSSNDYGVRPSVVAIEATAGGMSYTAVVTASIKGL